MRVVARQNSGVKIRQVSNGFAIASLGVLIRQVEFVTPNQLLAYQLAGILLLAFGTYLSILAWLEWHPSGFAVGMTRHGMIFQGSWVVLSQARPPEMGVNQWRRVCAGRRNFLLAWRCADSFKGTPGARYVAKNE